MNDLDLNELANSVQSDEEAYPQSEDVEPFCEFVTGQAGTGKTTLLKKRMEANPQYGKLCATTGIAAVNLNTITLNSVLKYFDTESMQGAWIAGKLQQNLAKLFKSGVRNIIVDEVSMMPAEQLDVLYNALVEVIQINYEDKVPKADWPGIVLTGDYCQLPPVNAKFAFEAQCWPKFAANTTMLTKIWRQDNLEFVEALNAFRRGDGKHGVSILKKIGIEFAMSPAQNFKGTCIFSTNDEVRRYNQICLDRVDGPHHIVKNLRWGKLGTGYEIPSDVKKQPNIPERLVLKTGALVMLLNNSYSEGGGIIYANGDLGTVVGFDADHEEFHIQLTRTGQVVPVGMIYRENEQMDEPDAALGRWDGFGRQNKPYRNEWGKWVIGGIWYYPIRLAYASTVHKTQGLTLEKVQIDIRKNFFGNPGMAYVALSRCRRPEGLRIVGSPDQLVKRAKADERVSQYF